MTRESSQKLEKQPEWLSFSALNNLTTCGERYRLERGLKIQGQPSWAQVGGSAVHGASEVFDRSLFAGTATQVGLFEAAFEKATRDQEERSGFDRRDFKATGRASKANPNKEDEQWWRENGPVFVQNWVTWRQMSPWEIYTHQGTPAIELELNPTLGGRRVKMYLDRIMALPSGELCILDLKSGAQPAGSFQLGVYKVGIEELLGVPITWGTFWMARTNTTTPPEDLSRWDQPYLDEMYWRMSQIVEQGLFLPNEDKHCGWCGVSDYCRAAGGRLAHLAQGDHVSVDPALLPQGPMANERN